MNRRSKIGRLGRRYFLCRAVGASGLANDPTP